MITLFLGGARSGKSAAAERFAAARSDAVTYLATAVVDDDDMAARVDRHRQRRPSTWRTVECGPDAAGALRSTEGCVLIDSLGTWVVNHRDFDVPLDELVGALGDHSGDVVIVSEEVGLGVHPETTLGREFRDVLGTVNQAVAAVADEVFLVVAGRLLPLQRPGPGR